MKKIILHSIAILGFALTGISQDDGIKITFPGSTTDYSSGHAAYVKTVDAAGIVEFKIYVENTTGSGKAWRVSRLNQSVPGDWTSTVCLGELCFAPSTNELYCTPASTGALFNVANNATELIDFKPTANSFSTATYRIYIGVDCTDFDDSVDVQVNYTSSIKEVKQNPTFSMYPNPVDDVVSITMNNSKSGTVKIVDLVGNVVYNEDIYSPSKINVSEFKNGIYFVTIEAEGVKLSSRKLVVRH
jgi:hypothetical protein